MINCSLLAAESIFITLNHTSRIYSMISAGGFHKPIKNSTPFFVTSSLLPLFVMIFNQSAFVV